MKKLSNCDDWLLDAEVTYRIKKINSRWEVSLIFIDTKKPSRIIIHKIGDYPSKRLAEIYAFNMQKTATKDTRGVQKVDKNAYNFNNN